MNKSFFMKALCYKGHILQITINIIDAPLSLADMVNDTLKIIEILGLLNFIS